MLFDADRSPKHFSPKTTGSQSEKSLSPKSQAIQIRQRDIIPPGDFLLKPNNFDLAKSYLNTTPRRKDEPVTDKIGSQIYQSTADSSRIATGKIPGYSGHIPGVIVGGVPGKTFTVLSKLDPKSVRAPPIWMTSYRENSGFGSSAPKSARFYTSATIDKEERAATYREYTAPEQQALTQKYSFGNSAITEELRNQKLITRPLKIPVSRSDSQTKAGDAWVAALSRGRPNERRALSPVGQRPDSESDLWQLCYRYLDGLGVSPDHFDSSLDKSYSATDPPLLTVAGTPYEVPIGWVGFGLRVPPWCDERDIWSHWHTTFLPCPPHCLTTVLHTCTPVMPGDSLIDGSKYKTVHLAQRGFVEAVQPNTRRADRCATRLYTTPSARYAAAKFLSLTRGEGLVVEGRRLCVALQCKQMGGALSLGGYQVCGETIGRADAAPPRSRISPYFDDTRIENYTLRKASVVPYRLLFRLADADSAAAAPTRSSPGPGAFDSEPLVQPYTRDLRWSRVDHPPFGSARSTVPGLELPFFEFDDPASARETTRGGLEPPRPHAPYACFPEHRAVRLPARPHMQPAVAEWTVRPTSGWLDGQPSPGNVLAPVPGAADHGPRTVQGVLDGMRRRIGAVASSFSEVLSRLDGAAAADGGGWISRGELARILTRLGLVVSEEDPLFGEVWRHLAPAGGDGGAALPVRELDRRFGVSAATHDILITLRQRVSCKPADRDMPSVGQTRPEHSVFLSTCPRPFFLSQSRLCVFDHE